MEHAVDALPDEASVTRGQDVLRAGWQLALRDVARRHAACPAADQALRARLREGDAAAHERLRYGMARHAAAVVADADANVERVFLVEEDATYSAVGRVTVPVVLVVVVSRKTPALRSLLQSLDAELTGAYRRLLSPAADGVGSLLHAWVVDPRDVDGASGMGALLGPREGRRALCLWQPKRNGASVPKSGT